MFSLMNSCHGPVKSSGKNSVKSVTYFAESEVFAIQGIVYAYNIFEIICH